MQLSPLKSSWRQVKLANSLQPIAANEVLSIISSTDLTYHSKSYRVILNLIVFVVLTVICQGG